MFKTILTTTDGSEPANRALATAIDLAAKYGARLYILHVHLHGRPIDELERMAEIEHIVPELRALTPQAADAPGSLVRQMMAAAEHEGQVVTRLGDMILRRAKEQAEESGVKRVETLSAEGDYADGILDAIDDTGADLVIMGRRGLGRVRQFLLGSVSNKVVQHAGSAVLLIQ